MTVGIKQLIPAGLYDRLWRCYISCATSLCSLLPVKANKVFITSYYGADYGDNAKYIVKELLARKTDADIVWQLKPHLMANNHLPQGVRSVPYYSLKAIYECQTAGIWIDNARKEFGKKRKHQLYLQTWHGGPGIKRCERDVEKELGERYVKHAKKDSAMCDIMLSNSRFMTDLFRRSFWYEHEILECGTPRNDIFFEDNTELKKSVKQFFGVPEDTHLLLYAPTFRSDQSLKAYDIDLSLCCRAFEKKFGGSWKALLRLHPNISDRAGELTGTGENVIPATAYPDMQELLAAADCLITDYSSSDVDFMHSGKPCFLYASDATEYLTDRGYYFEFKDFPFPLAQNNQELEAVIAGFDAVQYRENVEKFKQFTGVFEKGTAAKAVADIIENKIRKDMK